MIATTHLVLSDEFQTYAVTIGVYDRAIWDSASRRWYALAAATRRRAGEIESRVRRATVAGQARAYRTMRAHAPRNRYGFRIDHTGRAL